MSRSLPPSCARSPSTSRSARHGPSAKAAARVAGAAVVAPCAAAPPSISTAASLLLGSLPQAGPAGSPLTAAPVAAVLTIFEGQAVFRILSPGSPSFRAGDLLRFAYGSRTSNERAR